MQEDVRQAWIVEDNSLVSFFVDYLEMVFTCIQFCWNNINNEVPYYYYNF